MKAKITPKNILSFVTGHVLHKAEKLHDLPDYLKEQIEYRQRVCADCILLGECPVCHCPLPEKHYSYTPCDGNRYPFLMNKKKWLEFKKTITND